MYWYRPWAQARSLTPPRRVKSSADPSLSRSLNHDSGHFRELRPGGRSLSLGEATQSNLLTRHTIIEQALGGISIPITFLRPGWFHRKLSLGRRTGASDRVTPYEIAATFADLLGHPVRMEAVPRETWESLFKSQGMKNPVPRIRMLDGSNEGWIEFGNGEAVSRKGTVELALERERWSWKRCCSGSSNARASRERGTGRGCHRLLTPPQRAVSW